jgi:hypothetical protein
MPLKMLSQGTDRRFSRTDIAAVLGLVVLTIAAYWRTMDLYFLSDDFVLLRLARTFHGAFRHLFTTGGGDGFFRPVGYVSLAFTWTFAGTKPALWHEPALALHIANTALIYMLVVTLGRSRLAGIFAAALFAIHGTRPEALVWIAGRFDLLSTFFVLCGLLFFIRSQHELAAIGYVYALGSLACMVLAILSKENAYAFPFLLVFVVISKRSLQWRRIIDLIPFFIVALALFAYRWSLVGGVGGYRNAVTGKPLALTIGVLSALKALLLRIWAILFFPVNWSREPNMILAVVMIGYILALMWFVTARVNRKEIVLPLAFVFMTALPALPLLLIGSDLGKSRLLYLPSAGFCILLATVIDGLRGKVRWIIPGVVLVFHLAVLQHNLDSWQYVAAKAKTTSAIAEKCGGPGRQRMVVVGLPGTLRGVPFFANRFEEAVKLQRDAQAVPVLTAMSGSYSSEDAGSCVLVWDGTKDELVMIH